MNSPLSRQFMCSVQGCYLQYRKCLLNNETDGEEEMTELPLNDSMRVTRQNLPSEWSINCDD